MPNDQKYNPKNSSSVRKGNEHKNKGGGNKGVKGKGKNFKDENGEAERRRNRKVAKAFLDTEAMVDKNNYIDSQAYIDNRVSQSSGSYDDFIHSHSLKNQLRQHSNTCVTRQMSWMKQDRHLLRTCNRDAFNQCCHLNKILFLQSYMNNLNLYFLLFFLHPENSVGNGMKEGASIPYVLSGMPLGGLHW